MHDLAPHVARVRLAAEAALLRRLNAGAGFADARIAHQVFVRDPAAQARIVRGTLRPSGTHAQQAIEVDQLLAAATTAARTARTRLATAAERLGLDDDERALVEIAIAYALDADVRDLIHALAPRRSPALYADVAAELAHVDEAALVRALHPACTLRRALIVAIDGELATTARVSLAAPIVEWLAGVEYLPEPLAACARVTAADDVPPVHLPPAVAAAVDQLADWLAMDGPAADAESGAPAAGSPMPRAVAAFVGPRGVGRRAAAHRLARALGRPLLDAPLDRLLELEKRGRGVGLVQQVLTQARLRGALAYLSEIDALWSDGKDPDPIVTRALADHPAPLAIGAIGRGGANLPFSRPVHAVRMPRVDLEDRERAWQLAVADASLAAELGGRYVIGPGAIAEVAAEAAAHARSRGAQVDRAALEDAVARRLSIRLGAFGTLITRKARFDEMVLPADVIETLHDMIAMVRERSQILERWGYARHLGLTRGVSALFSGEPGTGKTMAASVVASELGLELMRIDLSAVISKYVGETEKNLARVFDQAQDAHAMLLFDEADSLFGKRTEVKTAQDRYANLEVNYLLQRMETFDGVSVLTSNLEGAIDSALLRRLNFRVRFPEPEADERALLWQKLLPPETGLHASVDFAALAQKFEMTGGYIKNAVVRAAVIAARDGRGMTPDDLWTGAHNEYAEMGKVMPTEHAR